ncbi:LPS export ABC transporter periplasmic protein LptC [Methyloglobulus sp.]|uniref:LPS export ABC transporter periplasmic protein LptC n=1 Tax=Methyloglobulus sp. TaxID=2518622 RepID=UPI0039894800
MTHFGEKFIYVFLAILALLSWWLAEYSGLVETSKVTDSRTSPDYFSKGYTKWDMDETGKLKSKLMAEEMNHYAGYWATHTKKPVMHFLNEKTPPWIVEAATGVLSKDGKKLQLNGKVTVNRAKAEGVRLLIINTSNLMVSPETSYAETKAWAELISPPNITTGTGMKVTFKEPIHLELLSKVKGKYETK